MFLVREFDIFSFWGFCFSFFWSTSLVSLYFFNNSVQSQWIESRHSCLVLSKEISMLSWYFNCSLNYTTFSSSLATESFHKLCRTDGSTDVVKGGDLVGAKVSRCFFGSLRHSWQCPRTLVPICQWELGKKVALITSLFVHMKSFFHIDLLFQ